MSGAYEQQRETRRGRWLVGLLAVIGAAAGALAGYRLDPDVRELIPSLAVAGFGLGGVIGLLLLAPVGLWRAWRRRARRRAAVPERAVPPDSAGLWHTADPQHEPAVESPVQDAVEAPTTEKTEPEPSEEPAPGSEEADVLTTQNQPEPEREGAEDISELEPEEPPPPAGEQPGWYLDPREGVRRYWDGHAWTGHVWRGRAPERTRKARGRR